LCGDSASGGEGALANGDRSDSQAVEKVSGEGEVNVEGNNGAGDLDVLERGGNGLVLLVYELNAEGVPVVACERGSGAER
jgi:hypothetical protein